MKSERLPVVAELEGDAEVVLAQVRASRPASRLSTAELTRT